MLSKLTISNVLTGNERAIIGAEAVGQLALVHVTDGQRLLTELPLLLPRLLLINWATSELIGFEGAKL